MLMNAIAGTDENDQTTRATAMETIPRTMSLDRIPKYSLHQINRNIRVGLVKELVEGADVAVSKCIDSACGLVFKVRL